MQKHITKIFIICILFPLSFGYQSTRIYVYICVRVYTCVILQFQAKFNTGYAFISARALLLFLMCVYCDTLRWARYAARMWDMRN
jgi:hypothetical protein